MISLAIVPDQNLTPASIHAANMQHHRFTPYVIHAQNYYSDRCNYSEILLHGYLVEFIMMHTIVIGDLFTVSVCFVFLG